MEYWCDVEDQGLNSWDEVRLKCPCGYECCSCGFCGKWTGICIIAAMEIFPTLL